MFTGEDKGGAVKPWPIIRTGWFKVLIGLTIFSDAFAQAIAAPTLEQAMQGFGTDEQVQNSSLAFEVTVIHIEKTDVIRNHEYLALGDMGPRMSTKERKLLAQAQS